MSSNTLDRRNFLNLVGAGALIPLSGAIIVNEASATSASTSSTSRSRYRNAKQKRTNALSLTFKKKEATQKANRDEKNFGRNFMFSKGLPHDDLGHPKAKSFKQLINAISSGNPDDFEKIVMGGPKKFKNPLAAFAYQTNGYDSSQLSIPAAPSIASEEYSTELQELYWMALLRDISFRDYSGSLAETPLSQLSSQSAYKGPKNDMQKFLRNDYQGVTTGPYVSQFLYRDTPSGSQTISGMQKTVAPNVDFLTKYNFWLAAQNGFVPGVIEYESTKRYIRNGRDLANFFHTDWVSQAFFNAALILKFDLKAAVDPGHPYAASNTMDGFGTFDYPHLLSLLGEVTSRALQAVWYQKWVIHRKIRPEEIGGRIHNQMTQGISTPLPSSILSSQALTETFIKNGTYLLPQTYPEGCPGHPAYASGHAVVAGACATILKAWFDESTVFPVVYQPNGDGTSLEEVSTQVTVGGELNKLAANQSLGRIWAGIHYRSDSDYGMKLGEEVAIGVLRETAALVSEKDWSLRFTRFDGRRVVTLRG